MFCICVISPLVFKKVSLRDKYDLSCNKVFVTGTQSLVRMCLLQSALDRSKGIATSGYITGYRGSPLGAIDQQFQKAEKQLAALAAIETTRTNNRTQAIAGD